MTIVLKDNTENPPEVVATVTLEDGMVFARVDTTIPALEHHLTVAGIHSSMTNGLVLPADGMLFMEALSNEFRSYVSAEVIEP